jgi:hypothetical protein
MLIAEHYMSDIPDEFDILIHLLLEKFVTRERLDDLANSKLSYNVKTVPQHYGIKLEIFADFDSPNDELIYKLKYPNHILCGVGIGGDSDYT